MCLDLAKLRPINDKILTNLMWGWPWLELHRASPACSKSFRASLALLHPSGCRFKPLTLPQLFSLLSFCCSLGWLILEKGLSGAPPAFGQTSCKHLGALLERANHFASSSRARGVASQSGVVLLGLEVLNAEQRWGMGPKVVCCRELRQILGGISSTSFF